MKVERRKYVRTDGTENEFVLVPTRLNLDTPEDVEQLGQELLQAAAEWRAEIEARGPPGPPAFKVFDFLNGDRTQKIASWVEHPWALVRVGRGTSAAFLVKERDHGNFNAWIVSAKLENGDRRWKCRFESPSAVMAHDLIHVFPFTLPDSPTLADIEQARVQGCLSF